MTGRPRTVLLTGSSGLMGELLRPRLRANGLRLRLLDLTAPADPVEDSEEVVIADVTDAAAVTSAAADVDAIVHLAGISGEDAWPRINAVNVEGTRHVLDAAVHHGVGRVVFASSNHAVGQWPMPRSGEPLLPADLPARPDSYYGWSKASGEALGRLYVDAHGLDVVALRIGTCQEEPLDERGLSTWLSPGDASRLVVAALADGVSGWHLVWGVSANTRSRWSPAAGDAIGYAPLDDAEQFAPTLDGGSGAGERVGGWVVERPPGERW